jgi:hypothetical protein
MFTFFFGSNRLVWENVRLHVELRLDETESEQTAIVEEDAEKFNHDVFNVLPESLDGVFESNGEMQASEEKNKSRKSRAYSMAVDKYHKEKAKTQSEDDRAVLAGAASPINDEQYQDLHLFSSHLDSNCNPSIVVVSQSGDNTYDINSNHRQQSFSSSDRRDQHSSSNDRGSSNRRDQLSSSNDRGSSNRRDQLSSSNDRGSSNRRGQQSSSNDKGSSDRRDQHSSRNDKGSSDRRDQHSSRNDKGSSDRRDQLSSSNDRGSSNRRGQHPFNPIKAHENHLAAGKLYSKTVASNPTVTKQTVTLNNKTYRFE